MTRLHYPLQPLRLAFLLALVSCGGTSTTTTAPKATHPDTAIVAELLDPAKLATLGERGATPRLRKTCYWLKHATDDGAALGDVLTGALSAHGMTGTTGGE